MLNIQYCTRAICVIQFPDKRRDGFDLLTNRGGVGGGEKDTIRYRPMW